MLANGGTELNKTSNLYDLEYRNYDQVLGRMNGVDPMTTKYASLTPYNFSFNDPVTFTDVSGADPWDSGPYGGSMLYYYSMNSNWTSPGQESIMDNSGNAFGRGGGNLSWNPATAGGYGMETGKYLGSMDLNYQGLQAIRAGRDDGVIITIDMSSFSDGSTLVDVENGEATSSETRAKYFTRTSDAPTREVNIRSNRLTNHYKKVRGADGRKVKVIDHDRGPRTIKVKTVISVATFAGGYLTQDIESGLKKMWKASYAGNGQYVRENAAYMTNRGLLILPNEYATEHSTGFGYYNYRVMDGVAYVTYKGVDLVVRNLIHTHPDMSGKNEPTPGNDFNRTSETVKGIIIGHFGVFEFFRDSKRSENSREIIEGSPNKTIPVLAPKLRN